MIFFTSDNHMAKKGDGKTEIRSWNAKVGKGDTVYIVGDLFSHNMKNAGELTEQLNGKKILIIGNNDTFWLRRLDEDKKNFLFEKIEKEMTLNIADKVIELSHFPKKTTADILICGHTHASRLGEGYSILKRSSLVFNAGSMICGGAPVSFKELVKFNGDFYCRKYSEKEKLLFNMIENSLR